MTRTKCLSLAAIFLFLCGCADPRTSPRPRSQARKLRAAAAEAGSQSKQPAASARRTAVVHATHLEPEPGDESLTTKTPTLLDDASPAGSCEDMGAGHDEASQVLMEAIKALRTKLTVISHNMANADTVGFKRSRVALEDCGYRRVKLPGAQDAFNNYAATSITVGHGCRVQSVETDFGQGAFDITNNPLDVAIEGDGFFQVIDPATNGFLYTRAGNLAVNANGQLVVGSSNTGRVVQPQISVPIDTTGIVISAEGNVSIQQFGQTQYSQIGQLQLAKFLNSEGLLKLGENLYQETLSSGAAIFGQPGTNGLGTLRQNALERSNVDLDEELLAWKTTERALRSFERLIGAPTR